MSGGIALCSFDGVNRSLHSILSCICILAIIWQCSEKTDSNVLGEITDDFYEASIISDSVHSNLLGLIHANKIPSFKHLLADMDSLVFQEFPEEAKISLQEGFYWAVPVTDDPHFPILDELPAD